MGKVYQTIERRRKAAYSGSAASFRGTIPQRLSLEKYDYLQQHEYSKAYEKHLLQVLVHETLLCAAFLLSQSPATGTLTVDYPRISASSARMASAAGDRM